MCRRFGRCYGRRFGRRFGRRIWAMHSGDGRFGRRFGRRIWAMDSGDGFGRQIWAKDLAGGIDVSNKVVQQEFRIICIVPMGLVLVEISKIRACFFFLFARFLFFWATIWAIVSLLGHAGTEN